MTDCMALTKEVMAEEKFLGLQPVKQKTSFPAAGMVKKQFFCDRPQASCVKIVGTFNNWDTSEASLMERKKDGTWAKSIYLEPGTYQYRFLIDDIRAEDQNNSKQVDNSFGGKNSVIRI